MGAETARVIDAEPIIAGLCTAFAASKGADEPYRHWIVNAVFPAAVADDLSRLAFPTVKLAGVSGKRELHNDQRCYFNAATNARRPICAAIAEAFQSAKVAQAIERHTGAELAGSFVRLEYAQDTDGFWLEPHTDLGVKTFTMLIYLDGGEGQTDLGTDIYRDRGAWAQRTPFTPNTALVFVPSDNTWHGLARRPIKGVRRSVIMNYVTKGWIDRSQLAFPDRPVGQ